MKGNFSFITLCPVVSPAYLCCVLLITNHKQRKRFCSVGCAPQASLVSPLHSEDDLWRLYLTCRSKVFSSLVWKDRKWSDGFCFSL